MKSQTPIKKKEWKTLEVNIEMTDGVSATYEEGTLTVKGSKGEVSKFLRYPNVKIAVDGNSIVISTQKLTRREKKMIFTYRALVNNMITGVTEGFEYELVFVYAKFPLTVEVQGNQFIVKNLLGERVPRTVEIPQGVEVAVNGSTITVKGIDKEFTGQVAASFEQLTRITHLDRRVVQDGIFITKKPHREYV